MANPNNVELDAAKFLHKLIQESKDEPKKMATKLYVILQHMRSSGKENSMPHQVISRAKETVVKQYGLANEALMSWGLPKPAEAQVEVAFSQVTGSLQNVEVTRDMTANFLGNEMVRPDAYASISAISGSSGSGRDIYQASGSHISGYPQSATEATQDKGDAMQLDAIFEMRESFDLRQPQPATEATLDKGDTLHFDASVDMLRLSDVAQKLSAPEDLMLKLDAELEAFNQYLVTDIAYNRRDVNSSTLEDAVGRSLPRLELEIGTQSLQLDSARHQVDDVDVDAMNCQSNAVTADLEKRNKTKRIELEYGITREVIKQQFGKKLVDAANSFGVARSTFKRICRVYKIYRWPRVKSRKGPCSLAQGELSQDVDRQPSDSDARHQQYVNISPRSGPKSVANSKELLVPMLSENVISVKVTYGNRTVRFPLSLSSGKKDLEEEVEKRIEIARNSSIRYEDEENDLILITCDSDLHYAMHTFRSLGRTIIRMLVEIEPGSTMT